MAQCSLPFFASLPNPAEFVPGFLGNLVSSRKYALLGIRAKPDALRAVASEVATGTVEVVIGETVALEDFREAYARAASGKTLGESVFLMESQG